MSKITADEARTISGPGLEDYLNDAYLIIRKAAEAKKRSANLHGDFWAREGYSRTKMWIEAVDTLAKDGFKVEFYYKEHSIAVDMYTMVMW